MDAIVYITMSLTIINLWQPANTAHIRKHRFATDFEDGRDPASRRLVEKSIFVAPMFNCLPGHTKDHNGKCLKTIRINLNKQYDFILAQINSKLKLDRDFFTRNKKEILEKITTTKTTTTTTMRLRPTTNTQRFHIKPMKNKRKMDRNTEGPMRIEIPISWEK